MTEVYETPGNLLHFVWSGWTDPGEPWTLHWAHPTTPCWQIPTHALVTTCRCSMFSLHAMSNHPASPAGRPKGLFYIQQFPLLLPKAKHRALLSVLLSALKATSASCESGCLVLSFLSPSTSLLTKKVGVFVIFYKSPLGWDPDPSCFPQNLHPPAPLVPGIKPVPKSP